MKTLNYTIAVILLSMFLLGQYLKPTVNEAYTGEDFSLESIVPETIGTWELNENLVPIKPIEEDGLEDLIYDQTLMRGYTSPTGESVMLVVAYGQRQSDTLQLHKPEVCYIANGFEISSIIDHQVNMLDSAISAFPVKRLISRKGRRHEPVTYWMRIGDTIAINSWQRQYEKLAYGLAGTFPDGLLFRVSSINTDYQAGFEIQEQFIKELLVNIDETHLSLFVGNDNLSKDT